MHKNHRAVPTQKKMASLLRPKSRILDVGCGRWPAHAKFFEALGHKADTVDFHEGATFRGDYNTLEIERRYDMVWCSHTLEHIVNPGFFISKLRDNTKRGGWLAITVPILKDPIVGGHLTLWNAGLLLYHLVSARLDCSEAKIKTFDSDLSVLVKKKLFKMPALVHDNGDLETLENYFPNGLLKEYREAGWMQGFPGTIAQRNWKA